MLRLMVSAGMLAALALSTASLSLGLADRSPPPWRAATMISRIQRVQTLPRFSSWRPLRCWMLAHLLCPATCRPFVARALLYWVSPDSTFRTMAEPLLVAKNEQTECFLLPGLAN